MDPRKVHPSLSRAEVQLPVDISLGGSSVRADPARALDSLREVESVEERGTPESDQESQEINGGINAISLTTRPIPIYLRLPNTAYGISMGLAGNAIMWKTAEQSVIHFRGIADHLNTVLWVSAVLVAILVTMAHVYKYLYKWPLFKAEMRDRHRMHFFNGPNLTLIMLGIGVPTIVPLSVRGLQIIFAVGLLYQTVITQIIYDQWLFGKESSVSSAKPQFLLSVVGWLLLATLGTPAKIEDDWGLSIPHFCLGIAFVFYLMVVFSIFNGLHQFREVFRGSPSLTLLLAPPSVAAFALDTMYAKTDASEFSPLASAVLGWAVILFILLGKIGPKILKKPTVFGEYWAYVFPLAALATAWLRYASVVDTKSAEGVALFFLAFATLALVLVLCRVTYHGYLCCVGKANWGDPLLVVESSHHPARHTFVATLEQKAENRFRDESMFFRTWERSEQNVQRV